MKRPSNEILIILIWIIIAALVIWIEDSQASNPRPRYTFTSTQTTLAFYNVDTLPFQIIREMCWNSSNGWCDDEIQGYAREVWHVTDWLEERQGAVWRVGNHCYWWMYQPEFGSDGQPHIREHYWVACPMLRR